MDWSNAPIFYEEPYVAEEVTRISDGEKVYQHVDDTFLPTSKLQSIHGVVLGHHAKNSEKEICGLPKILIG